MDMYSLNHDYSQVRNSSQILSGIESGREMFIDEIESAGFDRRKHLNMSAVHPYGDVQVQAFILGIPSIHHQEEILLKSYYTYGAHWLDDYYDRSNFDKTILSEIREHRRDLDKINELMGDVGEVSNNMIKKGRYKNGIRKAMHRMIYGGLIVGADDKESQDAYLQEHMDISLSDVDSRLKEVIKEKIHSVPFWMTTKTVQELLLATESSYDPNLAMQYDLLYAPALYYHDMKREKERGEHHFYNGRTPKLEDSGEMIKIFKKFVNPKSDNRHELRMEQLKFLSISFKPILPLEVMNEYQNIINSKELIISRGKTNVSARITG